MSLTRPPSLAAAMPRHNASSVTSSSRRTSSGTASSAPTATVMAESPCQPSTIAPQSMEMTSPSTSTREPGMPWTTSSLTEAQMVAGNGGGTEPGEEGTPPGGGGGGPAGGGGAPPASAR